jgi:DNA processing protein
MDFFDKKITQNILLSLAHKTNTLKALNSANSHDLSFIRFYLKQNENYTDIFLDKTIERQKINLEKFKINSINFLDPLYPKKLKNLEHLPLVLFYKGNIFRLHDNPILGVVGTRKPSLYGQKLVEYFIRPLTAQDCTLISGLAMGIDSLAHLHSLLKGIYNIAVLGSSLEIITPTQNQALSEKILDNDGLLLSEYLPGTHALARHFPRRNRIIAAICDVLWIPEALKNSGTRHTLKSNLELGKTVYCTPGDIFNECSALPNQLIHDGAMVALHYEDLKLALKNSSNENLYQLSS